MTLSSPDHDALPSEHVCEQARLSRDARFDGLFFTAVTSTRIYCRPVCPAPTPKRTNIVYYLTAAAAEAAGFRPCLRCRPELSPSDGTWRRGDAVVTRALKLINQGLLADQPLSVLAARVNVGERQLRRLFVERVGASPMEVHGTHRLLFAKQLLTETTLPITEVALAAGFGSVRRFNATFKEAYRMAARDLRRRPPAGADTGQGDILTLRLDYRPPYDFAAMLAFLWRQAVPGVEHVDAIGYTRAIAGARNEAPFGWLRVSAWPRGENALKLELHAPLASRLLDVVGRLRRMFDLEADPQAISAALSCDPHLETLLRKSPGLRLPGGWNGFEIAVRSVLDAHMSATDAREFTGRITRRFGTPLPAEYRVHGLTHVFASPEVLADAAFTEIGLPAEQAHTIRTISQALLNGRLDFHVERTLDDFIERWNAMPGISLRNAHDIALRALGHPDAFPLDGQLLRELILRDRTRVSEAVLRTRAEAWRPWRAYATVQLRNENNTIQTQGPGLGDPQSRYN